MRKRERRLKLETVSGDMVVDAGQVQDLKAGSGIGRRSSLTLTPAAHANIKLESMSGDLRVHLPSKLSAHIEATTFSGNIKSDFGNVWKRKSGRAAVWTQAWARATRASRPNRSAASIDLRKQ